MAANHRVVFGGPEIGIDGHDLKKNVLTQGFSFIELTLYAREVSAEAAYESYMQGLITRKPFKKFKKDVAPDLIILDIHYSIFAIPLWTLGSPIVMISTELQTSQQPNNVPLTSLTFPAHKTQAANKHEWDNYYTSHLATSNLIEVAAVLAAHHEFPIDKLLDRNRCLIPFSFHIPELILWPASFDHTHNPRSKAIYIGGLVDAKRREKGSRPRQINRYHKNIFVALGTRDANSIAKQKLIATLIDLFVTMPDVGVVIAGDWKLPVPDNVILVPNAPQLSILKNCDLMITHAGGNSIKECIRFGVPMLCIPSDNDQFGNAARVRHFKLGLVCSLKKCSKKEIKSKIEKIWQTKSFKQNLAKQKKLFFNTKDSTQALRVIESFLTKR